MKVKLAYVGFLQINRIVFIVALDELTFWEMIHHSVFIIELMHSLTLRVDLIRRESSFLNVHLYRLRHLHLKTLQTCQTLLFYAGNLQLIY